jgi:hypothetical protein
VTNPHFAWLPPEINSALMYAGPGAGPLLAAASAWNGLAGELHSSAASFLSVTQDLAGSSWLGPSAAAMMAVSAQYAGFLRTAAAQAEQAAGQAAATASAFEAALAATVQPAVVTANRGLVNVLAATNWLGQNAPAIMDIEAAYEQMWALDVAAMAGYHFDASAAAQRLAPWQRLLHEIGVNHRYRNAHSHGGVAPIGAGGAAAGAGAGAGNVGPGNAGNQNLGYGNTGSGNIGFGNYGNSNVGFGNTGSWDIGFGLTGDHQIGFGGFNSGSGNIGFGNSGTGNIGFFNSGNGNVGIGNSGSFNTGMWNSGSAGVGMPPGIWNGTGAEAGLSAGSPEGALLGSSNYVTGGLGAANFGSGMLNSAAPNTGGLSQGVASPSPAYTAPTASPAAFDTAGPGAAIGNAAGAQSAAANLRSPAAFYTPAGNDGGLRSGTVRDTVAGSSNAPGNGIPNSNFFKGDRNAGPAGTGAKEPSPAE